MRYALAISATKEQFTAAYVSIYSFRKCHPDASVIFFGDKPDAVLNSLDVYPVELASSNLNVGTLHNKLYTNNLCISLCDKYDAFVVASYDILYNKPLNDLVDYAIKSRHVIGSTKIVNNRLLMDKSIYIVPSNAINSKIRGTIFSGITKYNDESILVDAYYPILIDTLESYMLKVQPGVSVDTTDKYIIQYANDAWKSTPENDLWTKVGEEFIESLGKQ